MKELLGFVLIHPENRQSWRLKLGVYPAANGI
jgi:hypothetical protein